MRPQSPSTGGPSIARQIATPSVVPQHLANLADAGLLQSPHLQVAAWATPRSDVRGLEVTSETVWKQRLKDRDDVVRELMHRSVVLEQENEALRHELAEVKESKRLACKTVGTNTTYEWVAEQQQRRQLIALEEYMRLQEVLLYAEWFGLALASHRQIYHIIRVEQQLQKVNQGLKKGTLLMDSGGALSHQSGGSTRPQHATSPSRNGALAVYHAELEAPVQPHISSSASVAFLRGSVGQHTPSSATGAALHLLRALDNIQSSVVERAASDIGNACLSINRTNRTQLRVQVGLHQHIASVTTDEAETRRLLEQQACFALLERYRDTLVGAFRVSHQRQIDFLTRENKRMLEFAVQESSAFHAAQTAFEFSQAKSAQTSVHVQTLALLEEERSDRRCVLRAEHERWELLRSMLFEASTLRAKSDEHARLFGQRLEGSSVSLRHGEEPWQRSLILRLEQQSRNTIEDVFEDKRRFLASWDDVELRRRCSGASDAAVLSHNALAGALLSAHTNWVGVVRGTWLNSLQESFDAAASRVHEQHRRISKVVFDEERRLRNAVAAEEQHAASALLFAVTKHTTALRANRHWNSEVSDLLQNAMHHVASELVVLHRDAVADFCKSVVQSATECTWGILQRGKVEKDVAIRSIRVASRLERDELQSRSDLMLYEQRCYLHHEVLPFLMSVRETELNEEYGSMVLGIEDGTRRLMRRAIEREGQFATFFAWEGLLSSHHDLGVALMLQFTDLFHAFDLFIRVDVRKAERRILDQEALTCQRRLQEFSDAAALELRSQRDVMSRHVEDVRTSCSAFWRDVYMSDSERACGDWIRFSATEVLQWRWHLNYEMLLLLSNVNAAWKGFHANAQHSLVLTVMSGPATQLIGSCHTAALEYARGCMGAAAKLESNTTETDRAVCERYRLRESRLTNDVAAAERRYEDCHRQLMEEVRYSEVLKRRQEVLLEEAERRTSWVGVEATERLWMVYRAITVQRYLSQKSLSTSSAMQRNSFPSGAHTLYHPSLSSPSVPGASTRLSSQLLNTAIAQGSLAAGSMSPPIAVVSSYRNRGDDEEYFSPPAATDSVGIAAGYRRRSESEVSTVVDSDATALEARARRSSLVSSRSHDRLQALRGEGSSSPAIDRPTIYSSAVQAAAAAAGRQPSPDASVGATRRRSLTSFSPSPTTRATLLSEYNARIQSDLNSI